MILLIVPQSMSDFLELLELLELKEGVDQIIQKQFSVRPEKLMIGVSDFQVNQMQEAMIKPQNRQPKQLMQAGPLMQTLGT